MQLSFNSAHTWLGGLGKAVNLCAEGPRAQDLRTYLATLHICLWQICGRWLGQSRSQAKTRHSWRALAWLRELDYLGIIRPSANKLAGDYRSARLAPINCRVAEPNQLLKPNSKSTLSCGL